MPWLSVASRYCPWQSEEDEALKMCDSQTHVDTTATNNSVLQMSEAELLDEEVVIRSVKEF